MNALQMCLDGYSKAAICEHLGITNKTLWNWRQLPAWDEQVSLVVRHDSSDGQGQIKSLLPLATQTLKTLIVNGSETVKLGACRTILEAHANLVQREEQQAVIGQLEEQLGELRELAQAKTLAASPEPAIDVEIGAHAHADAHPAPVVVTEGQS